jgi:hypothetical protein
LSRIQKELWGWSLGCLCYKQSMSFRAVFTLGETIEHNVQ